MPTVADEQVEAYAHCGLPICPGSQQQAVQALKRETQYLYRDADPTSAFNGVERSKVEYVFADEADAPCPHCQRLRELSGDPRPQYQALSGFDPNYIAQVAAGNAPSYDPSVVNSPADEEVAALRAELAKLAAKLEDRAA